MSASQDLCAARPAPAIRMNPALDPEMSELKLTTEEKAALAAFLKALNGSVSDGL